MDEREYIRQLLAPEAHDTVDMLSSHRKGERERRVVAAFLRCLGVDFSSDELVTPKSDPPDVIFQDARFEVKIMLEGWKMHADWKKKANQLDAAQSLDDPNESYHPSVPITFRDMVSLVIAEIGQKASQYGPNTCSQLDALLYINLLGRHLYPLSEAHVPWELQPQGWRSVCFLFVPYSHVLSATPETPIFLRHYEGSTRQQCQNPDMMFDL